MMGKLLEGLARHGWRKGKDGKPGTWLLDQLDQLAGLRTVANEFKASAKIGIEGRALDDGHVTEFIDWWLGQLRQVRNSAQHNGWTPRSDDGALAEWLHRNLEEHSRMRLTAHTFGWARQLAPDRWMEVRLGELRGARQAALDLGWNAGRDRRSLAQYITWQGQEVHTLSKYQEARQGFDKQLREAAQLRGWDKGQANPASWIEGRLQRHAQLDGFNALGVDAIAVRYGWEPRTDLGQWLDARLGTLAKHEDEDTTMQRLWNMAIDQGWEPHGPALEDWYERRMKNLEQGAQHHQYRADNLRTYRGKLWAAAEAEGWLRGSGQSLQQWIADQAQGARHLARLQTIMSAQGWEQEKHEDSWLEMKLGVLQEALAVAQAYGWQANRSWDFPDWLEAQLQGSSKLAKEQAQRLQAYDALTDEVRDLAISVGWQVDGHYTPLGQVRHQQEKYLQLRADLRQLVKDHGWRQGAGPPIEWLRGKLHVHTHTIGLNRLRSVAENHGWPGDQWLHDWIDDRLTTLVSAQDEIISLRDQLAQAQATAHGAEALRSRLGELTDSAMTYGWEPPGEPGIGVDAYLHDISSASATVVRSHLTTWLSQRLEDADQLQASQRLVVVLQDRLNAIVTLAVKQGMKMASRHITALLGDEGGTYATTGLDQLHSWLSVRLKRMKRVRAQLAEVDLQRLELREELASVARVLGKYGTRPATQSKASWLEGKLARLNMLEENYRQRQPAPRTCALCTAFEQCEIRERSAGAVAEAQVHLPDLYSALAADCPYYIDKTEIAD
jgi:hypothetical protein